MKALRGLALALVCVAGCGAPPASAPAGPLGLEADLAVRDVPLGAPVRLVVRLRRDQGVAAPFPSVRALFAAVPGLAVEEGSARTSALPQGAVLEEREYTLRLFKVGAIELPALSAEGVRDGEPLVATTAALSLEALSVLEEHGPDIEEPTEPLGSAIRSGSLWPWAGAALLLVLGALAFVCLRRRRASIAGQPAPPPHLAALSALAAIRSWPRSDARAIDALVVACSSVVRTYIEQAFGLHAPDRTTEEFLAEARTARLFAEEPLELLARFLAECDRAKFAAWTPPRDRQEALLAAAERFIRSTAPRQGAS